MDKLLDKQKLIALSVALAAAIAVGVATSGDEPSKVDGIGIDLGDAGAASVEVTRAPARAADDLDTKTYNAQIHAYRAAHPDTFDLLTAPVAPGAQVTTGANVELGKRAADVQPVGGSWTIDAATFRDDTDHTWIEVTATNTGSEPARFVGIVKLQ